MTVVADLRAQAREADAAGEWVRLSPSVAVAVADALDALEAIGDLFGDLYLHHLGEITNAQLWASGDRTEVAVRSALAGVREPAARPVRRSAADDLAERGMLTDERTNG